MGKRKKAAKKPQQSRQKVPLDTAFTCLFCHHDKSVTVRLDRKEGMAQLVCRVCDQRYQSKIHHLTEPVDIYSAWIDAADAAQQDTPATRPAAASSSRPVAAAASDDDSDDD
ncbi:transcription elongation factor Elf1 like-domain-containing protein [Mycena albidolilacea]|uniref:Transcription elongation factor 1 homolog n=1 Tax=Mycena albidolilacea TaxID=1033008 RepID=A0AAD6ZX92_9AGAR|nr:transcription elongation factor Elf1 like-domain-containing protein [Mycena albidolilacea]